MPRRSSYTIELSPWEREPLEKRARAHTGPYREVVRAKSARNRTVLFGGAPTTNASYFSDIREFDGSSWSKIPTTGPVRSRSRTDGLRLSPRRQRADLEIGVVGLQNI